jgi:hypothetical protein
LVADHASKSSPRTRDVLFHFGDLPPQADILGRGLLQLRCEGTVFGDEGVDACEKLAAVVLVDLLARSR